MENVAVIGASANEDRYSCKAMKMLAEYGHNPIPVAPVAGEILGRKVHVRVADIAERVDTVTMYVGPARQTDIIGQIIALKPRRVIFNPGTENPQACDQLQHAGIEVIEACTLVMLRTGQF